MSKYKTMDVTEYQAMVEKHRGACGFCCWLVRGRCLHDAYDIPIDYHQARARGAPCGPGAELWECRVGSLRKDQ